MNLYQPTITGSLSVSGSVNISGSITIAGGGTISGTASIATTALTASSADNLLVRNTLTATTLVVQTITSSVIYSSGSNVFGNSAANTQVFTGSVLISGSVSSTSNITGSAILVNPAGPGFITIGATTSYGSLSSGGAGATLYMNGATRGGTTTAASNAVVLATDGDFYIANGSVNSFKMFVSASGNVGIGVTSTVGKLDINTGGNSNVVISNDSTDTGYNIVALNGTRTKGSYAGIAGGGSADNNLYLNSGVNVIVQTGASFTERMRITNTGALKFADGTLSGGGGFEITSEAFFGARFQSNAYKFMAGNNSTEYMRITSGGEIQSSGDLKFNSANTIYNASGILYLRSASTLNFGAGGSNSLMSLSSSSILTVNGSLQVGQSYDTPNALTIQTDLNWAFGCSSVSSNYWMQAKFYGDSTDTRGFRVYNNQNSLVEFRINGLGNAYTRGTLTQNASDKRLKTNIINIDKALEKVMSINGVNFDWIENIEELGFSPKIKKNDAGLLAQEIQSVLPQAIDNAPFDYENGESRSGENYLTVQYEKIVPLLVEAIKEQQAQIEAQQQQINTLLNK